MQLENLVVFLTLTAAWIVMEKVERPKWMKLHPCSCSKERFAYRTTWHRQTRGQTENQGTQLIRGVAGQTLGAMEWVGIHGECCSFWFPTSSILLLYKVVLRWFLNKAGLTLKLTTSDLLWGFSEQHHKNPREASPPLPPAFVELYRKCCNYRLVQVKLIAH